MNKELEVNVDVCVCLCERERANIVHADDEAKPEQCDPNHNIIF